MGIINELFNTGADYKTKTVEYTINDLKSNMELYGFDHNYNAENHKKSELVHSMIFNLVIIIPVMIMVLTLIVYNVSWSLNELLLLKFMVGYTISEIATVFLYFIFTYISICAIAVFTILLLLTITSVREIYIGICLIKVLENVATKESKKLICDAALMAVRDRI